MNNKPVAWMNSKGNVIPNDVREAEKVDDFVFNSYTIPLYTHPAKTLTDEEIKELSEKHLDFDWQTGIIEFARAILRKAQEK